MSVDEQKVIEKVIACESDSAMGHLLALIYKKLLVLEKGYKPLLTLDEASEYMGVSKSHIRDLCRTRKLAKCKPEANESSKSGRVFFKRTDLDEYMSRNRIPSFDEIDGQAGNYVASRQMV